MSNKEKVFIQFFRKENNWGRSYKKFFLCIKQKGYKKLLVSNGPMSGVDKIPTQDEYENSLEGDMDLNKNITKLGESIELAYEDFILFINTSASVGKVAFALMKNTKSEDFLEGNCKVEWDRLVRQYALYTTLSLQKLKTEFHNSKLELIDKEPDKQISHLEGLQFQMNEFGLNGSVT